jgi:hypothetical protein
MQSDDDTKEDDIWPTAEKRAINQLALFVTVDDAASHRTLEIVFAICALAHHASDRTDSYR